MRRAVACYLKNFILFIHVGKVGGLICVLVPMLDSAGAVDGTIVTVCG
jgi:hypothetical protein